MATTQTIDGQEYRVSGKMNVKDQFHVARKILPIFDGLGGLGGLIEKGTKLTTEEALGLVGPLTKALANLPDDHCDFVMDKCLALVQRKVSDNVWGPVYSVPAKSMMYDDIHLMTMGKLVAMVVQDQLMSFSSGPS